MKLPARLTIAVWLAAWPVAASADGGLVRLSAEAGPFRLTAFTSPTPLRAGPVDVSVLVQDAADGAPVLDAEVEVRAMAASGGEAIVEAATRGGASNRLLRSALLRIPDAGRFTLEVLVTRRGVSARAACEIDVLPALSAPIAYWPYFALPPAAIVLFTLRRWRAALSRGGRVRE